MKVAIVGSRNIFIENFDRYLTKDVTEIVSGGAKGVDFCAKKYAQTHNISYKEFLPDYKKYGKAAPLYRNNEIIAYSDKVLAFWDRTSKGTKYVIQKCQKQNKPLEIYLSGEDYFD